MGSTFITGPQEVPVPWLDSHSTKTSSCLTSFMRTFLFIRASCKGSLLTVVPHLTSAEVLPSTRYSIFNNCQDYSEGLTRALRLERRFTGNRLRRVLMALAMVSVAFVTLAALCSGGVLPSLGHGEVSDFNSTALLGDWEVAEDILVLWL